MSKRVLEITTKIGCSVNCKYCPQQLLIKKYYEDNPDRQSMMDFDTFKTCIDKVPKDVIIDFAGMAEPWLNPDCTKMAVYASEQGHKLWIYTTLIGMTKIDIEELSKLDIEQFVMHIPDNEAHTKIEITNNYIDLLQYAISMNKKVGFSCHGSVHDQIIHLIPNTGSVVSDIIDRAGNLECVSSHQYTQEPCVCCIDGMKLNKNILLPDGTVLLCCMDYGMRHVLGNLKTQSYDEITDGTEIRNIRSAMQDPSSDILCRKCSNALDHHALLNRYLIEQEKAMDIWFESRWMLRQIKLKDARIDELEEWNASLEKAKEWLSGQVESKDARIGELENALAELSEGKDWLSGQVETKDARISELENALAELSEGKDWLAGQVETKDARISELENALTELSEGKDWLAGQVETKDARISEIENALVELTEGRDWLSGQVEHKEAQIVELHGWTKELEKAKEYLSSQYDKEKAKTSDMAERVKELENLSAKQQSKLRQLLDDPKIKKIAEKRGYEV